MRPVPKEIHQKSLPHKSQSEISSTEKRQYVFWMWSDVFDHWNIEKTLENSTFWPSNLWVSCLSENLQKKGQIKQSLVNPHWNSSFFVWSLSKEIHHQNQIERTPKKTFRHSIYIRTVISFSSCQRNLIKTFQIEAMIALIKKKYWFFHETC